jgi:uncharacterized membrane protein
MEGAGDIAMLNILGQILLETFISMFHIISFTCFLGTLYYLVKIVNRMRWK